METGLSRTEALVEAGGIRIRPILMTSVALIAGAVPVAMGLSEASRSRMSMGIAIIGGMISSTLLSLIMVPAAYVYIDRFRLWLSRTISKTMKYKCENASNIKIGNGLEKK